MGFKLIVIINGKGGAGKDTLGSFINESYKTDNISSITPIKEIAARYGWNGEKDAKSRKFLADLKKAFTDYNDLPNNYVLNEIKAFLQSGSQIAFIHIREKEQIEKLISSLKADSSYGKAAVVSILVEGNIEKEFAVNGYGNEADDDVENFQYDYYFDNRKPLDISKPLFLELINNIIEDKGLNNCNGN